MIPTMRFSLATLLLVVFWIGAAMWTWTCRDPWQRLRDDKQPDPTRFRAVAELFPNLSDYSPDGTRIFAHAAFIEAKICDRNAVAYPSIYVFPKDSGQSYGFIDDNTIVRDNVTDAEWHESGHGSTRDHKYEYVLYRRRFPEWWWGHFYRPEVWLFAALSGVLIWRFVSARRRARDARAP
jgi:hypothetical protein